MSERFAGRREDERLVTGRGRFTADHSFPGELHAAFLRSDHAHADIALDPEAARAAPGVVAVFTGEDARREGLKAPPNRLPLPGRDGARILSPEHYALAVERVRFVGEAIALVIADTAAQAGDALDLIAVDYRDRPVAACLEDALAEGAPELHGTIPGNVCFARAFGDEAATDQAFSQATHVTRLTLDSQKLIANPLEPRACVVRPDPASGSIEVYCPSQGAAILQNDLAAFANLPPDRLRCLAYDVGGSFGARAAAYPEYAALIMAARLLDRPVRWVGSRTETLLADTQGRGIRLEGALALDGEGRFLAIRAALDCDLGAYLSPAGPLIAAINPSLTLTGAYRIPAAFGTARLVLTNTAPVGPYRGAGRPDMAYLVERLVDVAAAETGIDRVALRRLNLIPGDAFPYATPTAQYDSGDYPGLLDEALARADWQGFEARHQEAAARGRRRGIGLSVFVEPAGGGPLPTEEARITIDPRGVFQLHALSGSSGQGHETVLPAIVAGRLGIPAGQVALAEPGPDRPALAGTGTSGSRGMMIHASALAAAADALAAAGLLHAEAILGAAPGSVSFDAGTYRAAGSNRTLALLELADRLQTKDPHPLDSTAAVPVTRSYPSGAHVAEVEIDPETGTVEVVAYTAVDDAGRVLDHVLVEGQLHGGIAQGAGQVLGEAAVYDRESGQLLTASFMDYWMPRADTLPAVQVFDRSVPSPTNLLGAKGVGEAGTTGALPALANALADALGARDVPLPATPARVWRLLNPV